MIVLNIYLGFAVTAYAVDGRKGVDALIWSAHAVAGKWWKVFGRTIILILTCLAASGLLFIILFPLQQILGMAAWKTLFNGLMVFLNNLFIVPFAAIYSVMLYTELKKTKHAPSDLDQYRIRRNLCTMVVVGVVCAIAITVTSLRFIVPVVIEKMTYWPMMH
jgi:dolichyl-phosphate-mannose--protein O-mannosyl transferase